MWNAVNRTDVKRVLTISGTTPAPEQSFVSYLYPSLYLPISSEKGICRSSPRFIIIVRYRKAANPTLWKEYHVNVARAQFCWISSVFFLLALLLPTSRWVVLCVHPAASISPNDSDDGCCCYCCRQQHKYLLCRSSCLLHLLLGTRPWCMHYMTLVIPFVALLVVRFSWLHLQMCDASSGGSITKNRIRGFGVHTCATYEAKHLFSN